MVLPNESLHGRRAQPDNPGRCRVSRPAEEVVDRVRGDDLKSPAFKAVQLCWLVSAMIPFDLRRAFEFYRWCWSVLRRLTCGGRRRLVGVNMAPSQDLRRLPAVRQPADAHCRRQRESTTTFKPPELPPALAFTQPDVPFPRSAPPADRASPLMMWLAESAIGHPTPPSIVAIEAWSSARPRSDRQRRLYGEQVKHSRGFHRHNHPS